MTKCIKNCAALCIVIVVLLAAQGVSALAAQPATIGQAVRVGYSNRPGFLERGSDGTFFGYGAEYLSDICKYTDWQIEYVHAPFAEQLEMLKRGELDVVALAMFSPERAEHFVYTHQAIGVVQCLLLTLQPESEDIVSNALACNGKTIGVRRGSYEKELLAQYAAQLGFAYTVKEYDYQQDMEAALKKGRWISSPVSRWWKTTACTFCPSLVPNRTFLSPPKTSRS